MTSSRAPRFLAFSLALVTATGLSACSSDSGVETPTTSVPASAASTPAGSPTSASEGPSESTTTAAETTASSTSPESPSPTSSASAPSLGADQQEVTAEASGLSFGVPEAWVPIDPSALQDVSADDMPAQIVDMAKAQGMTTGEYLRQLATQMDLMVISPEPEGGFSDNVNVLKTGLPSMPSEGDIKGQLAAIGGTLQEAGSVQSPLGQHPTYRYTLPTPQVTAHGMFVLVEVNGGVRILTVSAGSEKRLQDIVDGLVPSLSAT